MKALSILIVAMTAGFSLAKAQQVFSNASAGMNKEHAVIRFTVYKETNVYQYRVEAGNDSTALDVIGTIKPLGYSPFSRTYQFESAENNYRYYRVAQVGMGAVQQYSPILTPQPVSDQPGHFPGKVHGGNQAVASRE